MIIAIKEKDRTVVGYSNTEIWSRLSDADFVDEENVAMKFSKEGKLVCCAKMDRASDILLYDEDFMSKDVTPKTIIKEIIPYIKEKLKENDQPLDEDGKWSNVLVVCSNDTIYDIDRGFGFREIDDFVCHGCRADEMKGVLDATKALPAEERIIKAANVVLKLYKESFFPLVITDTQSKQFKCVYGGGERI